MSTAVLTCPDEVQAEERLYVPHGALDRFYGLRDREIVVSGPAGTGKSRGVLERLYLAACKYDGCAR